MTDDFLIQIKVKTGRIKLNGPSFHRVDELDLQNHISELATLYWAGGTGTGCLKKGENRANKIVPIIKKRFIFYNLPRRFPLKFFATA